MRNVRFGILLIGLTLLALTIGLPGGIGGTSRAQANLSTFVDLPQSAAETYSGSSIYKAPISQAMATAVDAQTQENWEKYRIAKESNLGLPLGSIYLKAQNAKYVELAIYERAAFTVFKGQPARQILSAVLSSGRIQVTESEFVQLPENIKLAFRKLPIAGEGGLDTPYVETMNTLLTADKSKAVDAGWMMTDKMLGVDGTLAPLDSKLNVAPLPLAQSDATTGHRVPDVVSTGLIKMFGEKLLENAGLPLGPAVWVQARISGVNKPVVVQVFERMIVTYNPANDEANRVQVGLGGAIVHGGLEVNVAPTPTMTTTPLLTATPKPEIDLPTKYGRIVLENRSSISVRSTNDAILILAFERLYEASGFTGIRNMKIIMMPSGNDISSRVQPNQRNLYDGKVIDSFRQTALLPEPLTVRSYFTRRGDDTITYWQVPSEDVHNWQLALGGQYKYREPNGVDSNFKDRLAGDFLWGYVLPAYAGSNEERGYDAVRALGTPELCVYLACTAYGPDYSRFPLVLSYR